MSGLIRRKLKMTRGLALMVAFFLICGCATVVRNPSKRDQEAIAGGEKSVVLLQLAAEIDSKKS